MNRIFEGGSVIWSDSEGRNHRLDGPAVIRPNGTSFWYKHGVRHRINGPACYGRGERWYKNGFLHRTDGPAVILDDGKIVWFVMGERINNYKHFQELTGRSDVDIIFLKLKWGNMAEE